MPTKAYITIFGAFLLLFTNICMSQTTKKDSSKQSTIITQDQRIEQLIKKRISIEEKANGIPGFRVQIFFGSTKQKALQTKTEFLSAFENINSYVIYDIPYFKVRAGNFRTHLEAQKLLAQAKPIYPSAFIVRDRIEIPELKEEED